ncbi:hypothetical protein GCM10010502_69480 [Kitasatospora aureofaciens]|uniref:Uncharacterized protein n=1 Tax=Kitasatospora aureofaciens TaxID=1894 RepID=A0A8H9LZ19_KITAU|nr:hypothetical protein GCM10010502_69480 [Kitasatospora aureofaciens]
MADQPWRRYEIQLRVTVPDQAGEVGSAVAELPEQLASLLGGSGGGVRQMRDRAVSGGEAGFTVASLSTVCETDSCLYPTGRYRYLLGRDGPEAFERRWKGQAAGSRTRQVPLTRLSRIGRHEVSLGVIRGGRGGP